MHKAESAEFHRYADRVWDLMKEARASGHRQLESVLIEMCEVLHAHGSGLRLEPKRIHSILKPR